MKLKECKFYDANTGNCVKRGMLCLKCPYNKKTQCPGFQLLGENHTELNQTEVKNENSYKHKRRQRL